LILSKFYLPTDAQLNCLKNNFKIYIKIDIKTAPTCFGITHKENPTRCNGVLKFLFHISV
jgi:hypothetical protein